MKFKEILVDVLENVQNIAGLINSFEEGTLVVTSGQHEVAIETDKPVVSVYASVQDTGNMPVCQGNIDSVASTITDTGFVLYVNCASDSAFINYVIFF